MNGKGWKEFKACARKKFNRVGDLVERLMRQAQETILCQSGSEMRASLEESPGLERSPIDEGAGES
jgi:hypothetical protein